MTDVSSTAQQPAAPITVSVVLGCDAQRAWQAFISPAAIEAWNFASPAWCCPHAENDLRVGGAFCYRMEAKDGSMGFDFAGTFTEIVPHRRLRYALGEHREVVVEFIDLPAGRTEVRQTFTPDTTFPPDQQRAGWQAILDNYKVYVEPRG
ncbi:SRPBCC domain-containing protein [Acidovorax sp. sic0104]|uniref:SRPBCC domain-containing protein n=1 Tax=Acidovorax sp. sic0104 TaxID=2854784 RepID=UPI001C439E76|nr:SRPBCC domain-containing protein [Acidovorax sp. sic0104]MBV7539700.1 SRPBCC domain-containing protein [Acidovorax sp. sic0104]